MSTGGLDTARSPVASLGPGTRLDRYELHELLGEGGYGAVYRARHMLTQQWIALKVLRREAADAEGFERLVREARAVAALGDAHVVKVFDCGVAESGHAFLAMELLSGCDLSRLVQREGPFTIERSIDLALQILEGLAAAHDRGIVHRDIKPANVFVVRTEHGHDFVKLLDFGISKVRSANAPPLTLPGIAMGTPGYMAPEQLGRAHDADARADVYAVAVILFELLARERPFVAATYDELVVQVRAGKARPLASVAPGVPQVLADVVDRGLARDPDARWPTARAFGAALRAAHISSRSSVPAPAMTPTSNESTHARFASSPAPARIVSSPPPGLASGLPVSATAATVAVASGSISARPPEPTRTSPPLALIVGGVALLAAALGGGIVLLATRTGATPVVEAQKNAKPSAVAEPEEDESKPKPKKKAANDESEEDESDTPKAKGHIFSGGGVAIDEPRIVGDIDAAEVRKVLKKALPAMAECKRATPQVVMAQIHVHLPAKITLAQQAPDNKGDVTAARCVAQRFKDNAAGFQPGDSGIIFFEVSLDAK